MIYETYIVENKFEVNLNQYSKEDLKNLTVLQIKQLIDENNPVTPCSLHSGASPSSPPPTQIAFKLPNLEILILSVLPPPFFPL